MPQVRHALKVPYSAQQMFDLVIDIESYPRFVPGWRAARIVRRDGGPERGVLSVDQVVSEKSLRFRFDTQARYRKPAYLRIATKSQPFRYYMLIWRFAPTDDGGCRIGVHMRYALRAIPLRHLAERHFNGLFEQVVQSFEREARRRYGAPDGTASGRRQRAAG